MSHQYRCWIIFEERPPSYFKLVQALVDSGWSLIYRGKIRVAIEGTDGIGWTQEYAADKQIEILQCLREADRDAKYFRVDLHWSNPEFGIAVSFNDRDDEKVAGLDHAKFVCIDSRRVIGDPIEDIHTDRTWYEQHIISVFEDAGCVVSRIFWFEGMG